MANKNMTLEEIKKLEPSFFIKESNIAPAIYFTKEKIKSDSNGNAYIRAILKIPPKLLSDVPEGDNTFKYYEEEILFLSKPEMIMIARPNKISDLEIYNQPKAFKDLIKHIFN